jgi:hypothetical protein
VEFDSHDRTDVDDRRQIGGDQIVEVLVEPGDVRDDGSDRHRISDPGHRRWLRRRQRS